MIFYTLVIALIIIYIMLEINKYMEFKSRLAILNSPEGETSRITHVSSLTKYISEILSAQNFAEFIYGLTIVRGNPKIFTLSSIQENITKYISNRYRDHRVDYTQKFDPLEKDAWYLEDHVAKLYNKLQVPTFIKGKFGIDVHDVDCYPEPETIVTGLSYIKNAYYLPLLVETLIRFGKQLTNIGYRVLGFNIEPVDKYGLKYYVLDNRKNVTPKSEKFKICVFTHGIGAGVTPYYRFINQLSFYDVVMMIEQPNISFDHSFSHFPPARDMGLSYCDMITKIVCAFVPIDIATGSKQAYLIDVIGHSYGTVTISHIMNSDIYKNMIQKDPVMKFHKKLFIDPMCFSYSITKVINVILSDFLSVVRMKADDPDVIFTQGIAEGFGKKCSDMSRNELNTLKDPGNVIFTCPISYNKQYNPNYVPYVHTNLQTNAQSRTMYKLGGTWKYSNLPIIPLNEVPGNKDNMPFVGGWLWNVFMNAIMTLIQWLIDQQVTSLTFLFNFIIKCIATNNLGMLEMSFRVLFPTETFIENMIDNSTYFVICGTDLFVDSDKTITALKTLKGDDYVSTNIYYRKNAGHMASVMNYDHISDVFEKFKFYPYVELTDKT